MDLDRLLADPGLDHVALVVDPGPSPGPVEVTSITHDSRHVRPGALFCCVPGATADGHDFAPAAVSAGAVAVVCERTVAVPVPRLRVASVREAMGPLAAAFHGHPSRKMAVAGITGTNGKTTVAHLLRSILERDGRRTGLVGTLTGARTTPEAPELQTELARMADGGTTAVAMEVSSHALAQHRVDGTEFAVVAFTNLSRDHLDFHGSMDEYFEAKARLFSPAFTGDAVVDVGSGYGLVMAERAERAGLRTIRCSLDDAAGVEVAATASRFRWSGVDVEVRLGGRFNAANAIVAATTAGVLGVAASVVAEGIGAAGPVPGRFEPVDEGQPFRVVVDYAHTPDGLDQVLRAAREVSDGRVIVVFGCGGDRDRTKRPEMGLVAGTLADRVVLTNDNPRHEDPSSIIEEVRAGVPADAALTVEPDRRAAIEAAIAAAEPGDIVVIAGKGHETTQTIGDTVVPFDDRDVARDALAHRGAP